MFRLSERNRLRASDWLSDVTAYDWQQVTAPTPEGHKIQQLDLEANLNGGLVVQGIKDAFDRVIAGVSDPPSRTERVGSDGEMAVAVHKAMEGLTKREASDPDLWAYLCCFGCPQYVRWRWTTKKPGPMWLRYAGNIRRNALARLWWWAEVTYDPAKPLADPKRYKITRNVEDRQSLMLYFGDCAFSGHDLVAHELCGLQEKQGINDDNQKKLCRSVNRLARVICLDSLDDHSSATNICRQAHQLSALL